MLRQRRVNSPSTIANAQALLVRKQRALIVFGAALEAFTGLVLVAIPSLFGRLVLGNELPGVAGGAIRLAGIALLAFAVACWPQAPSSAKYSPAVRALVVYNLLAVLYLVS
jgi:hypothetical protein